MTEYGSYFPPLLFMGEYFSMSLLHLFGNPAVMSGAETHESTFGETEWRVNEHLRTPTLVSP